MMGLAVSAGPTVDVHGNAGIEGRVGHLWLSNDNFARDLLFFAGPLAELRYRFF